jgi:hypothetical protein
MVELLVLYSLATINGFLLTTSPTSALTCMMPDDEMNSEDDGIKVSLLLLFEVVWFLPFFEFSSLGQYRYQGHSYRDFGGWFLDLLYTGKFIIIIISQETAILSFR